MPDVSLLICDDSSMARKQLLRALPPQCLADVTEAVNGEVCLEILRRTPVDLVLLDLTMPVMDGYQVLAAMREEGLSAKVIVVSGDVQAEAVRRATELGAQAFLEKPVDAALLRATFERLGLLAEDAPCEVAARLECAHVTFRETFQEVVNVAMGKAGALLAKVLGVYVQLPVPNVNVLELGELQMALADAQGDACLTAVSQGYIAAGISGEALLIFHDAQISEVARLMRWSEDQASAHEMLLDLSCVVIGACLSGISEQLDLSFSQGHPQVLGQQASIGQLVPLHRLRPQKTLAVELSYGIEGHDIHFDLLLLFTEDSIPLLQQRLAYLMD